MPGVAEFTGGDEIVNHRYRKKPVVIEAFQMTRERREDNRHWPDWLNQAWQKETHEPGAFFSDPGPSDNLFIETLEGSHAVTFGDWIICGVKGELYPCKPDIFAATYEGPVWPMELRAHAFRPGPGDPLYCECGFRRDDVPHDTYAASSPEGTTP